MEKEDREGREGESERWKYKKRRKNRAKKKPYCVKNRLLIGCGSNKNGPVSCVETPPENKIKSVAAKQQVAPGQTAPRPGRSSTFRQTDQSSASDSAAETPSDPPCRRSRQARDEPGSMRRSMIGGPASRGLAASGPSDAERWSTKERPPRRSRC